MRSAVLAGGLGTRLLPYTTVLPKPLVPVGDRPVLEHMLAHLQSCGVTEVDLCVGHLGDLIKAYFEGRRGALPELTLRWHQEEAPLGTAGALGLVPPRPGETLLAVNGDVLTTLDVRELVDHHERSQAALTIATRRERISVDLGVVESAGGRVTGYREKPVLDYDTSMGIYAISGRAFKHLPDGLCQIPEFVELLLAADETVAVFPSEAEWYDIGTHDGLEAAHRGLARAPEASPPLTF